MTDDQRDYLARHYGKPLGRMSGWRQVPQCAGCKRFLKAPTDVCPSCGYAGHGGYVGVPAKTSYLERWR